MKASSHVPHNSIDQDSKIRVLKPSTGEADIFRQAPPLRKLKQEFDEFLRQRLQKVFDAVDDAFFDLADKAENNHIQSVYFDAMRIIRMERKALENHTLVHLDTAFRKLGDENWQGVARQQTGSGEPSLEVIENDELEEIIALDSMVSKSLGLCKAELEQLNARINFLVPATVTARNNPCSAVVVCDAFGQAIENLDLDIRAKLVLLKMFDRTVVNELLGLQQQSNTLLKDMGILPNLKLRRPPQAGASSSSLQQQGQYAPEQKLFEETTAGVPIAEASANYSKLIGLFNELFPGEAGMSVPSTSGREPFEHILSSLSVLQHRLAQAKGPAPGRINLSRILERQMQLNHTATELGGMDKGIIQLVDNLIDFYDQQTTFPGQISNLVQKLKAPVLRIALQDPSFFERTDHPARQLLNQVAELAIGLTDGPDAQNDPIYGHIDSLISQLASLENVDQQALTILLSEFMEKIDKSMRRFNVLEKRLIEQVSASEQNSHVHRKVNAALAELMAGKKLPRSVVDLVEQAWCKVLFLTAMRHGIGTEQWQNNLAIVKTLLTLIETEDRQKRQIDDVLKSIRQKLEDIAIDPYQLGLLVGGIEQFFEDQRDWKDSAAGPNPIGEQGRELAQEQIVVEKLDTQLPGDIAPEPEVDMQMIDETDLERADSLTRGSWIDLIGDEPGAEKERCKLAGIINPPGKYIFVNRQGAKVSEKSRFQVALDIKNKTIIVRDKNDIFDRALDRVLTDIRQRRR